MADAPDDHEGWHVPFRVPALIAVAIPLVLLAIVFVAGWQYRRTLQPLTSYRVAAFPAPGVVTSINTPAQDPARKAPRPRRDPAVERAKRVVVAQGLAGWGPAR